MRTSGRGNIERYLAFAAAMTLLAVVLFSAFFLAVEANHDCTGEDCRICSVMACFEHIMGGSAPAEKAVTMPAAEVLCTVICIAVIGAVTPVMLKDRLLN